MVANKFCQPLSYNSLYSARINLVNLGIQGTISQVYLSSGIILSIILVS